MRSRVLRPFRFLRDAFGLVVVGVGALTLRSICVGAEVASLSIRSLSSTRRRTDPMCSGCEFSISSSDELDVFGGAARGVRGGAT